MRTHNRAMQQWLNSRKKIDTLNLLRSLIDQTQNT
jgi:hypothetical protein